MTALSLDPYQDVGVDFLLEGNRLLADDAGLGKTIMAVSAAEEIKERESYPKRVLVLTKKSAITQWISEIEKWTDERTIQRLGTQDKVRKEDYTVMNYGKLYYRDVDSLPKFNILIVDESHWIRNRNTKRSKLVRKIARKSDYVWLLTATPFPNKPEELWAQLNCLSYSDFSSFWDWAHEHLIVFHNGFAMETGDVKRGAGKKFGRMLDKWMLRRKREDKLDLPPLLERDVYVSLSDQQHRLYREMSDEMLTSIGDEITLAQNTLTQLIRVRQITNDPSVLGDSDSDIKSGKTEWLDEHLEDLTVNEDAIIFSQFSQYMDRLHDMFGGAKLVGHMSSTARDKNLDKFKNDDDCPFLFTTLGAGGEALNLPNATQVIFVDMPWNPSQMMQAYSRAHRRGQTHPVHVIKLLAKNTVDEYMKEIVDRKDKSISKAMATRHVIKRMREERK